MESFSGIFIWLIVLVMVAAFGMLGIILLGKSKSLKLQEGIKPSKEEEIQTLMKEIERLRNYAQFLEQRLEKVEVAA